MTISKSLPFIILATILAFAPSSSHAFCSCVEVGPSFSDRLTREKAGASAVFLGKATRYEYVSGLLKNP